MVQMERRCEAQKPLHSERPSTSAFHRTGPTLAEQWYYRKRRKSSLRERSGDDFSFHKSLRTVAFLFTGGMIFIESQDGCEVRRV